MADVEETRAVVDPGETYDGRIIPSKQTAIDRPVRVREKGTVRGGVHGTAISAEREATIEGSIMASESVELTGSHIHGEVGTPGKVICKDARIEGTVTGKKTRLRGCVVRGNVVGMDVIIEDSVVLGLVAADREAIVEDSLCYTFRSGGDAAVDGAITVLPQAIVAGELDLASPVRVAGLGELETGTEKRLPAMTAADLRTEEGTQYLTLGPRILNLRKVKDRLAELEDGVLSIVDDTSDEDSSMAIEDLLAQLDVDTDTLAEDVGALADRPSRS
jgi:cytoskeletal protein CcmA (bactofilin family)